MNRIFILFVFLLGTAGAWEVSVGDLSARMDALEKAVQGRTPSGDDIGDEMESLRKQVKLLTGRCEELEHQLLQIQQQSNLSVPTKVDRVEEEGDSGLEGLSDEEAILKLLGDKKADKGEAKKEAVEKLRDARTKEAEKNPPTLQVKGIAQYDEAMALYNKNEFGKASLAFAEFTRTNPKDKRVADAFYWQGECLLKKGECKGAQTAFLQAFKKNGNKKQESLFGLGQALAKDNQKGKAKTVWTKLQSEKGLSPELRKKVEAALKAA